MSLRLRALDGLRGLLALYILAGHSLPFLLLPPRLGWVASLAAHGRAAVDLFFALSSLVILHALDQSHVERRYDAWVFLGLRAGRLMPIYLLALALACLGLWAGNPFETMPWLGPESAAHAMLEASWPPRLWAQIAAHLLLLQGLLPPALLPDAEYALLGPTWSLSTEWQFYGMMALCLACAPRLLARGAGRATALLLLLGLGSFGLAGLPPPWHFGRAFLPCEAWYFALGMASHGWLMGRLSPGRFALVLILSLAMSGAAADPGSRLGAMAVPLVWLLCLRAEKPRLWFDHLLRRLLTTRPLLWCGSLSYSLYLLHTPLQRLLMLAAAPLAHGRWPLFTAVWGLPALLLPIAAAALAHRWIEEPARQWSRTRLRGRARQHLTPFGSGSNTSVAGPP